jgi:hypothetical protein
MSETPAADPVWVRYLDWCSARVSRRFHELSADEVWDRVHGGDDEDSPSPPLSYSEIVRRLALDLYVEMELPSFVEWQRMCESDPESVERELIGFAEEPPQVNGPDPT